MNSQRSRNNQAKDACLRIIPLGGLGEIGKNTCVFEYGDDIMLVDAGLAFPSDGMHGVNVVMPDTSYLKENQQRIRGMIVTHGHEDHIGGISHHLKHFNIPVIHGHRKRGTINNRNIKVFQMMRNTADMIFMSVRDNHPAYTILILT